MKESINNQKINQRIIQSVHRYDVPSEVDKETALKSLFDKINDHSNDTSVKTNSYRWIRLVASIAAALVIAMITWVTLSTKSIRNESRQVVSLRLPDQSRVVLDSQSSVSFRKFFRNRKLKLEGKGYFEVKKGSSFQVITSGGLVEVLGTRFLTDMSNNRMQVICYEGKVKAAFHNSNEILPAGTGVLFTENNDKFRLTGKESYPGFALFSKEYHNENAETVIRDLEKFFNVRIINQTDQQRYFTGSITTGNLELALSIVTASLKLDFEHLRKNNIRIYQSLKQFNN